MYVFIFEDGNITKEHEVSEGDLAACESGYVDILDITNPDKPTRYLDESWAEVHQMERNPNDS